MRNQSSVEARDAGPNYDELPGTICGWTNSIVRLNPQPHRKLIPTNVGLTVIARHCRRQLAGE